MEHCRNCGQPIGELEKPQVWNDHIVCGRCRSKLEKSDTVVPAVSGDRNVTIRLGVGAGRRNEQPSRKLIYILVLGWVVLSVGSIIAALSYGYSTGSAMGHRAGEAAGRRAGYDVGKATGGSEGERAARINAFNEGFATGQTAGFDKGYRAGFPQGDEAGYVRGREDALAIIRKVGISSGTKASEVRSYLGTPDHIEQYTPIEGAAFWHPCWVYGTVRIYFDGDQDFSAVTHCEGDLKGLVELKLHPLVTPAQPKSAVSDDLPAMPDGFIPAIPAESQ